ncbi:hypothetical protein BpHYR1_042539 [Brachionus plicatilis]|uniref:Uncharacterized protein n=1 Tax=Brachionus plicatilis TaxID=10195 RepID=A0A3M7SZM0_BRAPC|nr:hypothetical protein BpHYR1_042539 [Brachionus plicatilis]
MQFTQTMLLKFKKVAHNKERCFGSLSWCSLKSKSKSFSFYLFLTAKFVDPLNEIPSQKISKTLNFDGTGDLEKAFDLEISTC